VSSQTKCLRFLSHPVGCDQLHPLSLSSSSWSMFLIRLGVFLAATNQIRSLYDRFALSANDLFSYQRTSTPDVATHQLTMIISSLFFTVHCIS